jgi:Fe-S oxidoreductase
MTTTYDPFDPVYLSESDLREELTRVYDLCHGCRLCFKFCDAFPSLFEMIDEHDDQDAARLTADQQDRVVDECFQCKLCYVNCPYIPGQSEWNLDFPRLMMRAEQVLHETRPKSAAKRLTTQVLGRPDTIGKINTKLAPLANAATSTPGSGSRKLLEKTVGIASERVLPPFARQRFSTWFKKWRKVNPAPAGESRQGHATLFPTCLVEYQATDVGQDMVKVYERNGVECSLPAGLQCCGAPWLHQGDLTHFRPQAEKNVQILADAIRSAEARGEDTTVVVPQPTCSYILKNDYPDYLGTDDAKLVAAHTQDAAEHLWAVHKADGTELDTDFDGEVLETVTYHAPCHLRAQNIGFRSRDLLKLTGAKVTVVAECSGIDGTWGWRKENYDMSRGVARKMVAAIDAAGNEEIAGDCHLANGGIVQETGKAPRHPLQIVARAYGIPEEK